MFVTHSLQIYRRQIPDLLVFRYSYRRIGGAWPSRMTSTTKTGLIDSLRSFSIFFRSCMILWHDLVFGCNYTEKSPCKRYISIKWSTCSSLKTLNSEIFKRQRESRKENWQLTIISYCKRNFGGTVTVLFNGKSLFKANLPNVDDLVERLRI